MTSSWPSADGRAGVEQQGWRDSLLALVAAWPVAARDRFHEVIADLEREGGLPREDAERAAYSRVYPEARPSLASPGLALDLPQDDVDPVELEVTDVFVWFPAAS